MKQTRTITNTQLKGLAYSLLAAPSIALAHGEEILFLPLGQIVSLMVVLYLLWRLPIHGAFIRAVTFLLAVLACIPYWFASHAWFPGVLWSATGIFLIGFLPPLLVVFVAYRIQKQLLGAPEEH